MAERGAFIRCAKWWLPDVKLCDVAHSVIWNAFLSISDFNLRKNVDEAGFDYAFSSNVKNINMLKKCNSPKAGAKQSERNPECDVICKISKYKRYLSNEYQR